MMKIISSKTKMIISISYQANDLSNENIWIISNRVINSNEGDWIISIKVGWMSKKLKIWDVVYASCFRRLEVVRLVGGTLSETGDYYNKYISIINSCNNSSSTWNLPLLISVQNTGFISFHSSSSTWNLPSPPPYDLVPKHRIYLL